MRGGGRLRLAEGQCRGGHRLVHQVVPEPRAAPRRAVQDAGRSARAGLASLQGSRLAGRPSGGWAIAGEPPGRTACSPPEPAHTAERSQPPGIPGMATWARTAGRRALGRGGRSRGKAAYGGRGARIASRRNEPTRREFRAWRRRNRSWRAGPWQAGPVAAGLERRRRPRRRCRAALTRHARPGACDAGRLSTRSLHHSPEGAASVVRGHCRHSTPLPFPFPMASLNAASRA